MRSKNINELKKLTEQLLNENLEKPQCKDIDKLIQKLNHLSLLKSFVKEGVKNGRTR